MRNKLVLFFAVIVAVLAASFASAASADTQGAYVQLHGGSVASAEVYCSSVSDHGPWGQTYANSYGRATCYGPNGAHLYARAQGHTDACHYYWWAQTNDAIFHSTAGYGWDIANLSLLNWETYC